MSESDQVTVTQRLRMLRPDSIRIKILVLAVLATLLPSLTTAWISYLENKSSLTAKATEELSSVSAQTARELDVWAKERRYDLRVFASSYEVTENVEGIARGDHATRSGPAYQRVTDYLKSVGERFGDYGRLSILDSRGRVVASSGEHADEVALPDDWQAQLRGEDSVVGTPYRDAASGRPQMLMAVPILAAGNRFIGMITAQVDLAGLTATLKRFEPGETGRVSLLSEDGSLIVSSRAASEEDVVSPYAAETIRAQLASDGRPVELIDASGERVLGSMRRVPGLDWVVVAAIPSAEVYVQLARVRNITLLIVAATLIVAGGVGYALGIVIVRPLDRLTRAAATVAAGGLEVDLPAAKGGEVGYLTEVFNDMVTRVRTSRLALERLSVTDPLTGLDNRRRIKEALQKEVLRARRLKHTFAVVMADVDHFKVYNDTHGHPAGDEALKTVARVLRETARDVDLVARYGGEEFFVLMPETSVRGAAEMTDRVRKLLATQPPAGRALTLSFGVAEYPKHGDSGDALIRVADAALYEAKRMGRDRVVVGPTVERAKAARG
ncbi:MAG TPA: diguanylate cyclase [Gammaproteobacteria bacterium]|nr:diguanylate cyclase [Gammaproteobacteria bacterium]